jgi:CRISPR-associated protein Cas2
MARIRNPTLSGYRFMWILVMFDLPVGTKPERRAATRFRNYLLDEGYEMSQFSIYMRFCAGKEQADRRTREIGKARPAKGQIHVLMVTDKQFADMVVFRHGERAKNRGVPEQLALF